MRGQIRPHGDGAWRVFVYAGTDPLTGKERRLTKVVRGSKDDAERKLTAMLSELDAGRRGATGARTLGDTIDIYLDHATLSVEPTTAATYRRQVAYIPDRLRDLPLNRVDVETLEALYAYLRTKGHKRTGGPLAAASVRNVHVVIYRALELARRRHWISVNPALDAQVPTGPRRLPSPAPASQIGALLAAAAAEHHALPTYLRVSVAAGGRRSEIHGLRWSGVIGNVITLRDTVVYVNGWHVKPRTKTGGQRTVALAAGTIEALRTLHDRAVTDAMTVEAALTPEAFVFSDAPDGSVPWNPQTTARRFARACAAAGLADTTRLHDLRHLMATYLIDQGIPVPVVASRLGHERNSTTLDIYTGRVADSDVAAAEVIDRLFD